MSAGLAAAFSALVFWPGGLGGAAFGWLLLWIARKLTARLQSRQGPPFFQPFFDFVKLLSKRTVVPGGVSRILFHGLPVAAAASAAFALSLIPAAGNPMTSFPGDVILLLYLLEMPAICEVLAGYGTGSVYGQVGGAREGVLWLAYNVPFLSAIVALAAGAGSFTMSALVAEPAIPVRVAAAAALVLALPARLKLNPFSIPNAEQEIVAGPLTEYNAAPLALFELARALELAALSGLTTVLFLPPALHGWLAMAGYAGGCCLVVAVVTIVAAATARLKVQQAFGFYWMWGGAAGLVALTAAAVW